MHTIMGDYHRPEIQYDKIFVGADTTTKDEDGEEVIVPGLAEGYDWLMLKRNPETGKAALLFLAGVEDREGKLTFAGLFGASENNELEEEGMSKTAFNMRERLLENFYANPVDEVAKPQTGWYA